MISPLKYTLRQLQSNTLFTLVKIFSLIIGFSVFLVLLSLVREELSYDKFWPNKNQLYRVAMDQYQDGELKISSAKSYRGLPGLLNEGWIFYISTVFETIPEESHIHFDVLMNLSSLFYYLNSFDNETSQLVEMADFSYTDPGPCHPRSWNNMLC